MDTLSGLEVVRRGMRSTSISHLSSPFVNMRRDEPSRGRLGALACVLGLAVLTKFTAWVAVAWIAGALLARGVVLDGRGARGALPAAGVLAGVAALGGWFYLRNWLHFGRPFVGNWDLPGRLGWWEQPGFHTADYYLRFGESMRHPFFAGYQSFWDGVYSTLWGDGLVAGMIRVRPPSTAAQACSARGAVATKYWRESSGSTVSPERLDTDTAWRIASRPRARPRASRSALTLSRAW